MNRVRAKFRVHLVKKNEWGTDISMSPVYSDDPKNENKAFWDATPSGELRMTITNEVTAALFDVGCEYYLDFTPAFPDHQVDAPAQG